MPPTEMRTLPSWVLHDPRELPLSQFSDESLPGFAPLPEGAWLRAGSDAAGQRAVRRQLLRTRPADVVAVRPGARLAAMGLLSALGGDCDVSFSTPQDWALALAANAVEDWVLMLPVGAGGAWTLEAAAVCFPAYWQLAGKLGKSMAAIHTPVPHYDGALNARVLRVFDRMPAAGSGMVRCNWGIAASAALFTPRREPPEVGAPLYLRVERQSLRKLPKSGAVAFGIRTYLCPLQRLDPPRAQDLLQALRALPREVVDYKMGRELMVKAMDDLSRPVRSWG